MNSARTTTYLHHAGAAAVALSATLLVLGYYGESPWNILLYAAVFLIAIVLPGTLVSRAVFPARGSLLVDVALGGAIGLLLSFIWWFIFVTLGFGQWMLIGCLSVIIPFLAVPSMRRHWRPSRSANLMHPGIAWGFTGLYIFALLLESAAFAATVPPAATSWYPDMYWHLGNSAGLMHQSIPQDMRVAGQPFQYHWFSSAHAAAMALMTGLDVARVLAHLWLLPIIGLTLALMIALLNQLTAQWWPGLAGGLLMVSTAQFLPASFAVSFGGVLSPFSPSQSFTVWIVLFILMLLVHLWQANRLPIAGWGLLVGSLLFAAGGKASTLPVILCGLALGLVVDLVRKKGPLRMGVPLALSALALVATLPLVSGGAAGTKIQFLSSLRRTQLYFDTVGLSVNEQLFSRGPILPELLTARGFAAATLVLGALIVGLAWLGPGAVALGKHERTSAGWVLLGIGFAGLCAALLIDQDGKSQIYFFTGGLVAWYVLAAWGLSLLASKAHGQPKETSRVATWLGTAVIVGLCTNLIFQTLAPIFPGPRGVAVVCAGLLVSIAVFAGIALKGARREQRRGLGLALAVAIVSASTVAGLFSARLAALPEPNAATVTESEVAAARWLREHSSPDDVVATNVHCRGESQSQPCENNSFWVSAFTERPVLLEGWAYTNDAHLHHGVNGLNYSRQPFADEELFELNERAFYDPTAETLANLRARGVQFLFADNARAQTSPRLADLATAVFSNDAVTIYRL